MIFYFNIWNVASAQEQDSTAQMASGGFGHLRRNTAVG